MAGIQEPSKQFFSQLFGGTRARLEIPSYQRSYSWTKDQGQDLLDDILRFEARHPGSSIDNAEYFLGSLVGTRQGKKLRVIDGQQRVATLTILLSSIRDALAELDHSLAVKLDESLIKEWIGPGKPTEPRLRMNDYDSAFFASFIQQFPRNKDAKTELSSHKQIRQVRDFFDERLTQQLDDLEDAHARNQWLVRLWQIVAGSLVVVVVEADNEDDATEVFEVLNERGVGLSTLDLLRNLLLGRAGNAVARSQIVDLWRDVYSVSDNPARVQAFLRHYWISKHGDVKSRGLYREIKEDLRVSFKKGDSNPVAFSEELSLGALTYTDLVDATTNHPPLDPVLTGIQVVGAQALLPPLIAVIQEHGESAATRIARLLLAHYVRWSVIGKREGTLLEQRVYQLATSLRTGLVPAAAAEQIKSWGPSDPEFKEAFAVASLTRPGHRRHVLETYERYLRTKHEEDELTLAPALKLHVEHLYPQTPLQGQRLADHDDWVNRIGNLTLLGSKWNTSIRNGDFATVKKPELEKSIILLNRWVTEQAAWSTEQIVERQELLAEDAPAVWPLTA